MNKITLLSESDLKERFSLADNKNTKEEVILQFEFHFKLPESKTDYELFLYSKGYYMEWMRSEWIKEKKIP